MSPLLPHVLPLTRPRPLVPAALATEPPTPDLLERKPVGRKRSLISRPMYRFILTSAFYQIFWVCLIFYGGPAHLDSYRVPTECDHLKTLPGYCCSAGAPCIWQASAFVIGFCGVACVLLVRWRDATRPPGSRTFGPNHWRMCERCDCPGAWN